MVKAHTPERIISLRPKKDITEVNMVAIAALNKKNTPEVKSPARPIFPDLYQEKFLYRMLTKSKSKIRLKLRRVITAIAKLGFLISSAK